MKKSYTTLAIIVLSITALVPTLEAQIDIPSDGSDGALNISSDTVIDLSQAVTGSWDADNSSNAGKGIYDPSKWAVVFKYSSVNIASNATVTFKNHPTHAPVVWLVSGDVSISGTLNLDGRNYTGDSTIPEPGPGGFRGGARGLSGTGLSSGPGFGPGGFWRDNGYRLDYGNEQIVPLIGGSGGGGGDATSGGAGGGAILIGASGNLTITGTCHANGGSGYDGDSYGGSGGAIRLIANQILGRGSVFALGGSGNNGAAGQGRIRLEANVISPGLNNISPTASTVLPTPSSLTIWPASNTPTIRLVSVAGQPAPTDPLASLARDTAVDTVITTNTATLVFETANFPTNGTVYVFVKPLHGSQDPYQANQASYVSGTVALATWGLQINLPLNYCVIQARAVSP